MDKLEQARAEIDRIDGEMAKLFESRMRAVEAVSEYKQAHGLPVLDADREAEVIKQAANRIDDEEIRSYYITFLKNNMKLSRNFQQKRLQGMKDRLPPLRQNTSSPRHIWFHAPALHRHGKQRSTGPATVPCYHWKTAPTVRLDRSWT